MHLEEQHRERPAERACVALHARLLAEARAAIRADLLKVRVGDGVRTRMFPILLLVLPLFLEQMGALAAAS